MQISKIRKPVIDPVLFEPLITNRPTRRFAKGSLLIQEGEVDDQIFILVDGKLRAFSKSADDKEVTFGVYEPIDILGELALDGGPRSSSVECVEDSHCVVIDTNQLRTHLRNNAEFSFALISRVIQRARHATNSARSLALLDVYGRLREFVHAEAEEDALGYRVFKQRLTQQDLANRLGASREMIARLLKDLERGGYLRIEDRRMVFKSPLPLKW